MTPIDSFERHLPDRLTELADPRIPDYIDIVIAQARRTRQRPGWTFLERWLPMALITQTGARARPIRHTWQLFAILAITMALVAGLVIAGARPSLPAPVRGLQGMVPVFTAHDPWAAESIDGLSHPADIDVGPDGHLYVVNGSHEILEIDPRGTVVDRWGSMGTGPGEFSFLWDGTDPTSVAGGVAVAPDGSVYVADLDNRRIQQFVRDADSKHVFVRQWGTFGTGDGQFLRPYEVAVDVTGRVYVADAGRSDIQRFTADGVYIDRAGGPGSGDGQLSDPTGMTLTPDGTVLVSDFSPGRVEAWDAGLGYAGAFPAQAEDLAQDSAGNLLLTDATGLTVLASDHHQVASWAPTDANPDDWRQVAVSPMDIAYVTSQIDSRIYPLAIDWVEDGASPAPRDVPSTSPSLGGSRAEVTSPQPSGASMSVLSVGDPFLMPFTLDAPSGWSVSDVKRGQAQVKYARGVESSPAWIEVSIPTNVYPDPCHTEGGPMSPAVGPTVDDLTDALTHLAGYRAGSVTDVVIDGHPGKAFDLDDAVDISTCTNDPWLSQFTFDGSVSGSSFDIDGQDLATAHQRFAVLDVDGQRVAVWTFFPDLRLNEVTETERVMETIHFQ